MIFKTNLLDLKTFHMNGLYLYFTGFIIENLSPSQQLIENSYLDLSMSSGGIIVNPLCDPTTIANEGSIVYRNNQFIMREYNDGILHSPVKFNAI